MRYALLIALVACGGSKPHAESDEVSRFDCKDRSVSYMATKHISGDELGVLMDCKEMGPRIKRWKTAKDGTRTEDAHSISPEQFEKVWTQVDGTGWPNLKDCTNGSLGKEDPVYVFDVKDDQNSNSFSCQTRDMPYPYHDITNPLDLAASQGQKQLGDDEPADLKKLDKKDKQK